MSIVSQPSPNLTPPPEKLPDKPLKLLRPGRSDLRSIVVVLLFCGAAIAGLVHLLMRELSPRRQGTGDKEVVAKLSYSLNTVQRKFNKEVLWDEVALETPLYKRDSVRTAEGSEAKIIFEDGTEVALSENSLIVLDRSNDKVALEFLKGNVFAKGGSKAGSVEIQTSKGKVTVAGGAEQGELSLKGGASGVELTVEKGSAQVQTATGMASIGENEKGELSQSGMTKTKILIFPDLPIQNAKIVTTKNDAMIPFDWHVDDAALGNAQTKLQVATDEKFKSLAYERPARSKAQISLKEGNYYWRVVAKGDKGVWFEGEARNLRVIKHTSVALEFPPPGYVTEYFQEQPHLRFSWKVPGKASGGTDFVQLAADAEFKVTTDPARIERTPSGVDGFSRNVGFFNKLRPTAYFWRVITVYDGVGIKGEDKLRIETDARKFTLVQLPELPAPEPLTPERGQSVGVSAENKMVRLTWTPVPEAKYYELKVATDFDMKKIVVVKRTIQPAFETELNASGKLYWQVRSLFAEEADRRDSKPSKIGDFFVTKSGGLKLLEPADKQVVEYGEDKPDIVFEWEPFGGADEYEIQIGADPELKNPTFVKRTRDSKLITDRMPEGVRYWRVRALNSEDKPLALSRSNEYRLKRPELLVSPDKVLPPAGWQKETRGTEEVHFGWKPSLAAKTYQLTVWRQDSSGKLEKFLEKNLKEALYETELKAGVYFWDVRATDQIERIGPAGTQRKLEIRLAGRLVAPEIKSPAIGAHFEDDDPFSIELEWKSVDGATAYDVRVEQILTDGSRAVAHKSRVNDRSIKLPKNIVSGNYEWSVAAVGVAEGAKEKTPLPGEEAASKFSVKWIGVLTAPRRLQVKVRDDDDMPSRGLAGQKEGKE